LLIPTYRHWIARMAELKTKCDKCGVDILQTTADHTGGLCMPCKLGRPPIPPPTAVKASCFVSSSLGTDVLFITCAQDLLTILEGTRHIGDSSHPNKVELDAQRALLRHAIRHRVDFHLHDDHWGRTGFALVRMFEDGSATLRVDGKDYHWADVIKEEWSDVRGPLVGEGGFLYRDLAETMIYKTMTWVS
jgi:hypothetical protein